MRIHLCRHPEDCAYCERRAEALKEHEDWTDGELDDMADYAAAAAYGGGHP